MAAFPTKKVKALRIIDTKLEISMPKVNNFTNFFNVDIIFKCPKIKKFK